MNKNFLKIFFHYPLLYRLNRYIMQTVEEINTKEGGQDNAGMKAAYEDFRMIEEEMLDRLGDLQAQRAV